MAKKRLKPRIIGPRIKGPEIKGPRGFAHKRPLTSLFVCNSQSCT